jgi:hypothetical protein
LTKESDRKSERIYQQQIALSGEEEMVKGNEELRG